ncbi:MAG TPA: ABC transporter ATP-binding protein [Patescibacteria group bacterium]|nr:ABC transporter ATP-binding protein [Patescibacteria group bacterium]
MQQIRLSATGISKTFQGLRPVFKNLNIHIANGDIFGITGSNGSGKSTLLKILSGTLLPSSGSLELKIDNKIIPVEQFHLYIGFVSPYLALYEEFTPLEHCAITSRMRGIPFKKADAEALLEQFGLFKRRDHEIRMFSSGMKQRVKYILALLHAPAILFLDEPTTNLDAAGIDAVETFISFFKESQKTVIIATNDERERAWCNTTIAIV